MTQQELANSPSFQGLFQFTFEEALKKRLGRRVDVTFADSAQISLEEGAGAHSGRFRAWIESPDGPAGETEGTLLLHLPHGLDGDDPSVLLNEARVEIAIETFPFV